MSVLWWCSYHYAIYRCVNAVVSFITYASHAILDNIDINSVKHIPKLFIFVLFKITQCADGLKNEYSVSRWEILYDAK